MFAEIAMIGGPCRRAGMGPRKKRARTYRIIRYGCIAKRNGV